MGTVATLTAMNVRKIELAAHLNILDPRWQPDFQIPATNVEMS